MVNSSKNGEKSYTVAEDAHMQTWKTEKNSNYGSSNFLTAGLIKNNGLLGEKFTSTNTNDGTDGKMIFLKFDLSEMKQEKGTYDSANLTLTYICRRGNTKVAGVDKDGNVTPKGYGKTTIVLIAGGTSEYKTAVKEVTVTVVPAKVTGVSVSNKKAKQLAVKWKKNKNVSGYQIQYATNKSFAKAKTVKASSAKSAIRKLKKGKKYYVRVRAYKSINGEKFVGSWSKAKVKKVK